MRIFLCSFFFQRYRWAAVVAAALWLGGCGGGSGDAPGSVSGPGPDLSGSLPPGTLVVRLPGVAAMDTAYAQSLDFPDRDLPSFALQGGRATLHVPVDLGLVRIYVGLKNAQVAAVAQAEQTTVDTPQGDVGTAYGQLLVAGQRLTRGGVALNPLSDYISRRMDDYFDVLTPERIQYFQDQMAAELMGEDITGDGVVNFDDVLAFDPDNATHRSRVAFDYARAVSVPLSLGRSLEQTYRDAPLEIDAALHQAFAIYEGVPVPREGAASLSTVHIDVDAGGSLRIDELPQVTLDAANPRMLHQYDRHAVPPATLTLRATPDPEWRFVRWVGCPEERSDGSCRITAQGDHEVGAQFGFLESTLAEGVEGIIKLAQFAQGSYVLSYPQDDTLLVSNVSDPALVKALEGARANMVLATRDWDRALQRITAVEAAPAPGVWRFRLEDATVTEVYKSLSTFDDTQPPTFDDIESVQLEIDGVPAPNTMLRTARLEGSGMGLRERRAEVRERTLWLAGLGRGLDAGHGYYLVQNPHGPGFALVRAEGAVKLAQGEQARRSMQEACTSASSAPDCIVLRAAAPRAALGGSNCTLIPQMLPWSSTGCNLPLIEIEARGVLVGKFTVEGNIEVQPQNKLNYRWMPMPVFPFVLVDLKTSGRGVIKVTLVANAFIGALANNETYQSLKTKDAKGVSQEHPVGGPQGASGADMANQARKGTGQAIPGLDAAAAAATAGTGASTQPVEFKRFGASTKAKNTLVKLTLQLNKTSPEGVVFPLQAVASVVTEWEGKIGLDMSAAQQVRFFYDADVDIGASCTKVLGVTLCQPIKIPQRLSGYVKVKQYQKFKAGLVANFEFAPGLDIGVQLGPRTIAEELIKLGATASLPIQAVGSISGVEISNFPEDKAQQVPALCKVLRHSLALGVDARLEAYARIDPALQFTIKGRNIKLLPLPGIDVLRWSTTFPVMHPQIHSPAAAFPDPDECLPIEQRPPRLLPDELVWERGKLAWDEPSVALTKTHKLALLESGNVELYTLQRTRSDGPVTGQRLVWQSSTGDAPGTRVTFGRDGRLTTFDVRERATRSFPSGAKQGVSLHLLRSGKLLIRDAKGSTVWSVNG